jgi:hypothetical protein
MTIVGFNEPPAKFVSQQFADCRFPSARDSEDDYDHGALLFPQRSIFSTTTDDGLRELTPDFNACNMITKTSACMSLFV